MYAKDLSNKLLGKLFAGNNGARINNASDKKNRAETKDTATESCRDIFFLMQENQPYMLFSMLFVSM